MTDKLRRSASGRARLSSAFVSICAVLRTPLIRNGYSLIASTGMNSALGLIYWVLAARLYTVEEVGLNAALISTMMALGAVAQLNLGSVLTRFLPSVGRSTSRRMILCAYAIGMVAALACCGLFLLATDAWAPSLRFLSENPWFAAWFTVATMIWTVYALQEGALAGLRRAVWVPVESTLFGFAKIGLLVLCADSGWKAWGLFASWTLPLLPAIAPMSLLIFGYLLGSRQLAARPMQSAINARWLVRYFGSDFLGTLFFMAATGLAPILVLEQAGVEANARYYLAWTITHSLYLISMSMGVSLVAEGAADPQRSKALAAGAFAHTMGLLVVAVLVVVAMAPLILQLFGASYAREGSGLLRILALSALPFGVTAMFLGLARIEGRMTAVVLVQAALALLVLGVGVPLLDLFGMLGIGIAWLSVQLVIAIVVGAISVRRGEWPPFAMQNPIGRSMIGVLPDSLRRFWLHRQ